MTEKKKKPFYKRWWFIALVLIVIIGALGGGDDEPEDVAKEPTADAIVQQGEEDTEDINSESKAVEPVDTEPAEEPELKPESEPEPVKDVPQEYKNALRKAEVYSDSMHMSKPGIYDQLTSEYGEGFPEDAAQYAVENIDADWNANALEKAKTYYEDMAMSKDAVYDQLTSEYGEQFTAEQAQYAIDNLTE